MIHYAELYKEYLECKSDVDTAIERCIANSSFIKGPEVKNFEKLWKLATGAKYAVGVSSGTSALMLALAAYDIGPGDEVIVPSMSFISTAEVVSQLRATPVFVDVDEYHTIDIHAVKHAITPNTKAIIFVDLYGQTCDINALKKVAGGIPLIQDAAQSAVCHYHHKKIGSLVNATCFSFYPGKNLSAMGDAGAITCNDKQVYNRLIQLRDHGRIDKYVHLMVGWNERLDGLQAAILSAKLPYLGHWNAARITNAIAYFDNLTEVPGITLPKLNPMSSHVFNQFVIQYYDRNGLKDFLLDNGIETGVQFPLGMHQQPVYQPNKYKLPQTEKLAATCLSLPIHAQLTNDDVVYICDTIKKYVMPHTSQPTSANQMPV